MPSQLASAPSKHELLDNDADHGRRMKEENKRIEEENEWLEEENKQLERRNKLLERNKDLLQRRSQLLEKNQQLKKRKVGDFLDDEEHQEHPSKLRRGGGMESAIRRFFSSPRFAVAGASSDADKYGHKVFVWFLDHKLHVTPINPSAPMVTTPPQPPSLMKRVHLARPSPLSLDGASDTSLSIITPPKVTRSILEDALKAGVRAVWLQPGSFDRETLRYAREHWPDATVAGTDVPGSRGHDGWCVLVDGGWGLALARRDAVKVNGKI